MAIVTMKRLRLIAMRADREELMEQLQRLGCVEIDEIEVPADDPDWAGLTRPTGEALASAQARQELGQQALDLLKKYGGVKGGGFSPRPKVSRERFFDEVAYIRTGEVVDNICAAQWGLASLETEAAKLHAQRQTLQPWLELEVPLETTSTDLVTAQFGTLPVQTDMQALTEELGELCTITTVEGGQNFRPVFFLCHKSVEEETLEILQNNGFSRTTFRGLTGTAAENDRRLAEALEENSRKADQTRQLLAGFSGYAEDVKLYVDRARQKVRNEEAAIRLVDTRESFCLSGWFPAEDEEKLRQLLDSRICAWESEQPAPEEYPQVPVKLKNNRLTAPLNMVTEMYSLPAYDGIDPNPLMAPFFILFYGMMMADMGYGLLMILASLVVTRRVRPKGTMGQLFQLLLPCGITTFLFGAMTGGFFGDFIPQLARLINPNTTLTALPSLFTPTDDMIAILVGSLVLGLVQIFTGMAVSFVHKLKRGEVASAITQEVAWWAIFGCIAAMVLTKEYQIFGIAIAVIFVATQGYGAKNPLKWLVALGGSLYNNITGYFSDILSYSRLMALMLSGAVVAQAFNTLGAMPGNPIFFVLIAMVGNALNFALNLLGCYVHDLRLQCLEFFNRFYKDGGEPFRPLDMETQYVDIE